MPRGKERSICQVRTCNKFVHGHGYCSGHYQRLVNHGDVRPDDPLQPRTRPSTCTVPGCEKRHQARGYCSMHYYRWEKYRNTDLPAKADRPPTRWLTRFGYIAVYDPTNPMANSSGNYMEHRGVMAERIGRPLTSDESVHHINGDRADNRIESLELWNKSQPAGQRVTDKVSWAVELLRTYAPHLLSDRPRVGETLTHNPKREK